MEMFSKELKELDRNTVQYMIDEMQEQIDGMKRELSDKDTILDERDQEIARLKQQLKELQDTSRGKSSSIKAILNKYYDQGLRMIEVYKHQFQDLNDVIAQIKNRGLPGKQDARSVLDAEPLHFLSPAVQVDAPVRHGPVHIQDQIPYPLQIFHHLLHLHRLLIQGGGEEGDRKTLPHLPYLPRDFFIVPALCTVVFSKISSHIILPREGSKYL